MSGFRINKGQLKQEWAETKKKTASYHIHIYTGAKDIYGVDIYNAIRMTREIGSLFPDAILRTHRTGATGPHSRDNMEMNIKPQRLGDIVAWLQQNHKGLSILIRPETKDISLKNYRESSIWIGKPVPFNPSFFSPVVRAQKRPSAGQY